MSNLPVKTINPGELHVSNRPCLIKTLLGSCVSVCIYNHEKHFGGMNHFMLPSVDAGSPRTEDDFRFGDLSTESLIESMLEFDSHKNHLTVKVFGGGRVVSSLSRSKIGQKNINSAHTMVSKYHLEISKEYVGKDNGVKIIFNTGTGKVRLQDITSSDQNKSVIKKRESNITTILSGSENTSGIDLTVED